MAREEDALEHLASIDLIQLCNEAKIERCRAIRDLSCCGRYVQHVLNSCGHASLCAECSQRCDACPICRTSLPKNENRLRLRLYNKCIEAGLISKRYDDRFQEKKESGENLMADIQRLYSLFDVALENNLVSLICHYVTDVCMDESAVSSDPVLAFLLDEVVVKDWCKRTFKIIICELKGIYSLGTEAMKSKLLIIQKFGMQLVGISSVLEVMVSSLKDTFSAQIHDLHDLFESTLKAKQHLEIMTWCIQHQFLENLQPCYPNYDSWNRVVHERKSAAIKRSWPDYGNNLADSAGLHGSMLFIEQALSNLAIEEGYTQRREEEIDILCLQDGNSPLLFRSRIDEINRDRKEGCYPFENLRAAIDVLFLHGTSDTIVAKHATFLYYLFDRYWTRPDAEWRYFIDDFAACFGITRHSVLESLVFYLLDDHTSQALQEAIHLLPEIASPETHPRIPQVLLERECPDVALTILRCSGRDGSCASATLEHHGIQHISLGEAVTAVRVRVECGLLTEAFMYQRMHCLKQKEEESKNGLTVSTSYGLKSDSWIYHVEVLVTEICHLCIRRNLVDRMIEFPWNSDEEKFLHKCLFDYACQEPSTLQGSFLVVYYLQRYQYIHAYQVDRKLQNLERNIIEAADEEVLSRIRSISNWRSGLVDKCLDLLPEAQRQKVMTGNVADIDGLPSFNVNASVPAEFVLSSKPQTSKTQSASSSLASSLVLQINHSFPSRKTTAEANINPSSPMNNGHLESCRTLSSFPGNLRASMESTANRMNAPAADAISSVHCNGDNACSNDIIMSDVRHQGGPRQRYSSFGTPLEEMKRNALRTPRNDRLAPNFLPFMPEVTCKEPNSLLDSPNINKVIRKSVPGLNPFVSGKIALDRPLTGISEEANMNFSWRMGDSPMGSQNLKGGSRWRSDESSEEDEGHEPDRCMSGVTSSLFQRRTRIPGDKGR